MLTNPRQYARLAEGMREYASQQARRQKDQIEVQQVSYLRAGLASALMTAPPGVFPDGFNLDAAAAAALRAGYGG